MVWPHLEKHVPDQSPLLRQKIAELIRGGSEKGHEGD